MDYAKRSRLPVPGNSFQDSMCFPGTGCGEPFEGNTFSGKYVGVHRCVAKLLLKIDWIIWWGNGGDARCAAAASADAWVRRREAEAFETLDTAKKLYFKTFVSAGCTGNRGRDCHVVLQCAFACWLGVCDQLTVAAPWTQITWVVHKPCW